MNPMLTALLNHQGIRRNAPALQSDIQALLEHLKADLPEELLEIWCNTNGFRIPSMNADLMSVSKTLEFLEQWDKNLDSGLLPILDTHSSNYVTVAYREMQPRVAWMPHDGDAKLLYRTFQKFLEVLLDCLEQNAKMEADEDFDDYDNELINADLFFSETQGDFGDTEPRTAEDQTMAQKLLQSGFGWNPFFAIQLLDETNPMIWSELLEDESTRGTAMIKMRKSSNPEIKTILEQDQLKFEQFVGDIVSAAKQAGLDVEGDVQSHLKFNGKAFTLQRFFCRRHLPNAVTRTIHWFEDLIAGRNPRSRENHIFAD